MRLMKFDSEKKSRSCSETSWWLNQPIWKICSSNWIISPRFGVKIKNVWNHLGKYHWTKVTIVKFEALAKHDRNAMVFLGGLSSRRTHFPPSRMENLNLGEISHDDRFQEWGTKPLKPRQHFAPENRPFNTPKGNSSEPTIDFKGLCWFQGKYDISWVLECFGSTINRSSQYEPFSHVTSIPHPCSPVEWSGLG